MEFVWSETLAQNTIHSIDYAHALIAIAAYALPLSDLLDVPGLVESLPTGLRSNEKIQSIEGAAFCDEICRGAVFTVVDDGETDQRMISNVIEDAVGVECGFVGAVVDLLAKLNMDEMIEDVNEKVSRVCPHCSRYYHVLTSFRMSAHGRME